jgi:acetoacetyl-CoA synthetase
MSAKMLWQPSDNFSRQSNLWKYIQWVNHTYDKSFSGYEELWNWSVTNVAEFWESLWKYFSIMHEGTLEKIVSGDVMPHTVWFKGTRLNYAEHIFRNYSEGRPAILFQSENSELQSISWKQLKEQTSSLQNIFKDHCIGKDDTVVAYLPCVPEATIGFLATSSIGAIWSSCSPDLGTNAIVDRFSQIKPKVLIATDHYHYNGKKFDKKQTILELLQALPSLELVIVVGNSAGDLPVKHAITWSVAIANQGKELTFLKVPFSHPIWVLYSSGTTGLPKAITHSQGGILLEQLKYATFHNDFKPGENCFWYTTTGWMMWNYIHGSLLTGSTMVLYDGSPAFPDLNVLWKFIEGAKVNHFGTSAGFILSNMKENILPSGNFDLTSLRSIGSTGSTLPPEGFKWIYDHVKKDLWLASMSGGTDVCSAFVGGNPLWPVYEGQIQCRALGCSLEVFDEGGKSVTDEEGEMVITQPMPSMPVFFWNDADFKRYRESYFEMYPQVWRHGDWIRITPENGVIIYGRSDATLNRGGVRIGTSEIYRAIDQIIEIKDSLIICLEKSGGEFWMPLFVLMKEGQTLTDDLRKKINQTIRNTYSPRHVPDEIIAVPDIPYTVSGKKTEMPVKKILQGKDPEKIINAGSLKNPAALDFFTSLYQKETGG